MMRHPTCFFFCYPPLAQCPHFCNRRDNCIQTQLKYHCHVCGNCAAWQIKLLTFRCSNHVDHFCVEDISTVKSQFYSTMGTDQAFFMSGGKRSTVYPKKYAHGFAVLCFVVVMQSFIMNSHEVFIHIHQGCFAGTGAIVRLPQCQWSKPDGYGKISQCITTKKHSKAKTVCIFLGIYCTYRMWIIDDIALLRFTTGDISVLTYLIYTPYRKRKSKLWNKTENLVVFL